MAEERRAGLIALPETEAPQAQQPNRILITFIDDHSFDGAKFEILGVTPEQIAVAIFHLERSAMMLADSRQLAAARENSQLDAIKQSLHRERRHRA
jgi:hypothetical protein